MKRRTELQDRGDLALDDGRAGRGSGDSGQDLEQRALPRTVLAHQPEALAVLDGDADVGQRAELLMARAPREELDHPIDRTGIDEVGLAQAVGADGGRRHDREKYIGPPGERISGHY
jgi:hypothetical protein